MHIVRTLRALKPLCKLLLRTFLTEITKGGPFLFITMFILKDGSLLLASEADTIPQVSISAIPFEAPDDGPSWYPSHEELLLRGRTDGGVLSFPYFRRTATIVS